MAKYNDYGKRLTKAIEHRKCPVPDKFIELLKTRAKTDRKLDTVIYGMIEILEPKPCVVTHCPHHTVYGFCGCGIDLQPSKCAKSIKYHKDKNSRESGIKKTIVDEIISLYKLSAPEAEIAFKRLLQQSSNSYKFVTQTWDKYKKENQPKK